MRKKIFTIILLAFAVYSFAQEQIAFAGPKGIFVYLGKDIPNGVRIESIQLSRKEENGSFKKLKDVKCASTEQEFIDKAKDAAKYFPDFDFPPDSSLKIVWAKASKYGLLDSAGYWAMHPALRMALGILYYDLEAKENTKYNYKFNSITSAEVSFPFYPKFDTASLNEYQFDKNGLYIRFRSIGKSPAKSFKVFKYNDAQKPEEVSGIHSKYSVKDTTYYIIVDKKVTAAKKYQYSLVGVDFYGNTSYGFPPVIISLQDFSTIIFNRTKATRAKGFLGITLNWKISDVRNVKSIHIFRSKSFDKDFSEIGVMRATDTTFTDESIEPDRVYYYYLQIADETNTIVKNSAKFFDFGFDTNKPITPIITEAVGLSNGVKLNVAVPDNFIAGYRVFRSENGNDNFTVIADLVLLNPDSNTATFYDTGATMSGRIFYNYKVQSENTSHVVSDMSNSVQVHPEMSANVSAPTNLLVYFQDSIINIFWNDMRKDDEFVSGFRIYKRESGTTAFTPILPEDSIIEGNKFTDLNYKYGKVYEYEVESVDLFGFASKERASAQVNILKILPAAPVINSGINLPDGILIEWTKPNETNIKQYKIYRYQRGESPKLIATPEPNKESYLDQTAKSGELYFYTIATVDMAGNESTESAEIGARH